MSAFPLSSEKFASVFSQAGRHIFCQLVTSLRGENLIWSLPKFLQPRQFPFQLWTRASLWHFKRFFCSVFAIRSVYVKWSLRKVASRHQNCFRMSQKTDELGSFETCSTRLSCINATSEKATMAKGTNNLFLLSESCNFQIGRAELLTVQNSPKMNLLLLFISCVIKICETLETVTLHNFPLIWSQALSKSHLQLAHSRNYAAI